MTRKANMTVRPGLVLLALGLLGLTGCRQQMAEQPYFRTFEPTNFFADGRSSRPLVQGTVPRGGLRLGPYYTGLKEDAEGRPAGTEGKDGKGGQAGAVTPAQAAGLVAAPTLPMAVAAIGEKQPEPKQGDGGDPKAVRNNAGDRAPAGAEVGAKDDPSAYLDALPFAPEKLSEMIVRGKDRYEIFCTPCHDRVGTGQGMIVQRGFTPPPSFHTDDSRGFLHRGRKVKLREAPVGYYFDVITHGYGAMGDYREVVAPADRWAIVAYIRALQFSQNATIADVQDEATKQKLVRERGVGSKK